MFLGYLFQKWGSVLLEIKCSGCIISRGSCIIGRGGEC